MPTVAADSPAFLTQREISQYVGINLVEKSLFVQGNFFLVGRETAGLRGSAKHGNTRERGWLGQAMNDSVAGERVCPRCAETIKAAATVCRFCGVRFDADGGVLKPRFLGVGWRRILVIALVLVAIVPVGAIGLGLWWAFRPWSEAERLAGAHCINPLLGTSLDVHHTLRNEIAQTRARNFKHRETWIGPRNAADQHPITVYFEVTLPGGGIANMRADGAIHTQHCSVMSLKMYVDR